MNALQKELFRLALLRVLDTNRTRFGLGVVAIGHRLNEFSFSAKDFGGDATAFSQGIEDGLGYLTDKGLAEEVSKEVSKENRAWKITGKGIAFVDERA